MFATSHAASQTSRRHAGAYHQIGVETSVVDASPHRLVTMMFDAFADSLAQARGAMQTGDVDHKGRALSRAIRIVTEGLRGGLDLAHGGALAAQLDELYGYVAKRLTHANAANDEAALGECQRLMQPLREAWTAINPVAANSAIR